MDLRPLIAGYPGFPREGVLFRDFGPLLADHAAVSHACGELLSRFPPSGFDLLAGIESRGFIVAAHMSARCGRGMAMVRKAGKLPGRTRRASYATEYGADEMEVQEGAVRPGQRVLVCDDLLATGGTAEAAAGLVEGAGAEVAGMAFVVELRALGGRERLAGRRCESVVEYRWLGARPRSPSSAGPACTTRRASRAPSRSPRRPRTGPPPAR